MELLNTLHVELVNPSNTEAVNPSSAEDVTPSSAEVVNTSNAEDVNTSNMELLNDLIQAVGPGGVVERSRRGEDGGGEEVQSAAMQAALHAALQALRHHEALYSTMCSMRQQVS